MTLCVLPLPAVRLQIGLHFRSIKVGVRSHGLTLASPFGREPRGIDPVVGHQSIEDAESSIL